MDTSAALTNLDLALRLLPELDLLFREMAALLLLPRNQLTHEVRRELVEVMVAVADELLEVLMDLPSMVGLLLPPPNSQP
jgi:hypothetical protein